MFPKRAVGTVVGIGGMAGAIGGVVFPWVTGKLLDEFKAQGDAAQGYAILFGICAFAYLVTFIFHHLLAPRFQQVTVVDSTRLARLPFVFSWLAFQGIAATLARLVSGSWAPTLVYVLVLLSATMAAIAVLAIGRLHDLGRPGRHYWLLFVPVYNVYVFLLLLFKRGTVGANAFGADPLARERVA
jgi:uncharacterized membrane protein YhaH (DUF805 family)